MPTLRTLFSGGELFGVGAQQAGYTHTDGYEIDPKIAAVAQLNGFDVRVADVCAVDYAALPTVNHLHASPSCKNASNANQKGVDENGDPVTPSAVAAVVARREIARVRAANPEANLTVLYNLITSRIVRETIEADGAKAVRTKVGHSLIKDQMADTNAIFGGEHSAHYYFRDFWGADNGMLAAMHVLAEFGSQPLPLSQFTKQYNPYFLSGEINSTVVDVPAAKARVQAAFQDANFEEFDGITISSKNSAAGSDWWWFNVRASNTEPLLRLNVEAETEATMVRLRDQVLSLIRA